MTPADRCGVIRNHPEQASTARLALPAVDRPNTLGAEDFDGTGTRDTNPEDLEARQVGAKYSP